MVHETGISTGLETKGDTVNWALNNDFKIESVMENLLLLLVVYNST